MLTGLRAVRVILDAQHEPVRENPKNPYPERGRDSTRRPIRATGVVVRDAEGCELEFRALAEVILCCGAIDSPRLLQLSGIGPRHVLEAVGVPVLADVPGVGENLQDHAEGLVVWEASEAPPPVCASGWMPGPAIRALSSTPSCASTALRASAWPTPRCFLRSPR